MASSIRALPAERPRLGAVLYDYAVRSHLWVAGAVTSLGAFVSSRLEHSASPTALGIVFLSTLLIYNLDTTLDLRSRALSAGFQDHSRLKIAGGLSLGSLIGLLALLGTTSWQTAALVSGGASVSCLYAVPLGKRRFRLKALPGAKSLIVGGAVAVAVVCVPLVEQARPWTPMASMLLWLVLTATITNATLFDVRDLAEDRARGLRTLPAMFGLGRTRLGLASMAGASLLLLFACEPALRLETAALLVTLVSLIAWLGPDSPPSAYAWLVDGALLLPWALTLGR